MNDFKTSITEHAYTRIKERLERMTRNNDITIDESNIIETNLNNVLKRGFTTDKSFGIKIGSFRINPKSTLVTEKHNSGVYYEIYSSDSFDVVKDSTGNEFWVIVRNNNLVTAFLRKTVQRRTANKPRNEGGLGVDYVIDDISKMR